MNQHNSSLTTDESNTLNAVGTWIQAIGAILVAIAQSKSKDT